MKDAIVQHLSQDPVLKKLTDKISYREPSATSQGVYKDLLSSIISQQLSGKVATVIKNRFFGLFENGYPHPVKVLEAEMDTLRSVGLSRQKATYLQNVAAFFESENIANKNWEDMGDDAIIEYFTQIKGVGKWTVEMILMFSLGRPDVLPLDDLGIRMAITNLYNLTESGKALRNRMIAVAEPWRPYRTYACWYLWRYKDEG